MVTKVPGQWGRGTGYATWDSFLQGRDVNVPAFLGQGQCSRVEECYLNPLPVTMKKTLSEQTPLIHTVIVIHGTVPDV
jgi:hypothetical protein